MALSVISLPADTMRKNTTLKTGDWNFLELLFSQMRFLGYTDVMSQSWAPISLVDQTSMEVMKTGCGSGEEGRTGKNGSCMTWSVAPGSRPSFHTDPVQWLLRATAASAASAGAGVSTGATAAIDASASGASAAASTGAITGALQCPAWGPLYEGWVRGDG